jgi:hypothetical protein
MHAALSGAQWLQALRGFLFPRSAILMKHPVQRSDHHTDADRICIVAAAQPAIERRQQYLFGALHCQFIIGTKRFILDRATSLACPRRHVKKISEAALLEAFAP